ncbi:MAG: YigZ family protein [Ruminococcaceae bacterium]|nr:YigZ family protein [Oscillospiraceae bacterium]
MQSYITVKNPSVFEYEDRKSVFIGMAMPVSTEAEAIAFIDSVKKQYPDARHHVYAYALRENSTMRFTDDREPQGTAGMPVLDVIRKNGCTDVVIVVTRYFGGTLLGTGGLVRAYTAAAIGALENAEIIRYDIYSSAEFEINYSDYGKISPILSEVGFRISDTIFEENVKISGSILSSNFDVLREKMTEITSGRVEIKLLGEKFEC